MSYGVGEALQSAVYQTLVADATLAGLVGTEIYDAAPAGVLAGTYVSLGPEEARDRSAMTSAGAVHEFTVSVISDGGGFAPVKAIGAAISDALVGQSLTLSRGRLVALGFLKARARRVPEGDLRRLDLVFRAHVEDD